MAGVTDSRWMTVLEVAEVLGKGPRTVQRLAERGALPYEAKLPGKTGSYLFNRSVVERFARNTAARVNTTQSPAPLPRHSVKREAGLTTDAPPGEPGTFPHQCPDRRHR